MLIKCIPNTGDWGIELLPICWNLASQNILETEKQIRNMLESWLYLIFRDFPDLFKKKKQAYKSGKLENSHDYLIQNLNN